MNINKVILLGRLTADPELKQTGNGVSVVQFTVAVNRAYSKEDQKTDFLDCTAFNKKAEFLSKYFRKGSSVIVFGNIQVESFTDKEGNKRKSTRIIVDEVQFGESKQNKTEDVGAPEAPIFEELSPEEQSDLPF